MYCEKFDFFWEKLGKPRIFQSFNVSKISIKFFRYVKKKYKKRKEVITGGAINSCGNSEFNQRPKSSGHEFSWVDLKIRFFSSNQLYLLKPSFLAQIFVFRKTIFDMIHFEKYFSNLKKIQPGNNFSDELNLLDLHKFPFLLKKKKFKNFKEFFYGKKKNNKYIFHFKDGFKKFFREIMFFFFWINFWERKKNFLCSKNKFIQEINVRFLFKSVKNSPEFTVFKYFFLDIRTFSSEKLQSFDILFQLIVRNIFYEKKFILSRCAILISDLFKFTIFVYKLKKAILILELLKGSLFHLKFIEKSNQERITLLFKNSIFFLKIPNKIQKIFTLIKIEKLELKFLADLVFFFLNAGYVDVGRKMTMNFFYKIRKVYQIELIKKIFFFENQKKNFCLTNKILIFLILNFKNQISACLNYANRLSSVHVFRGLFDFINDVIKKNILDSYFELKNYFFKFIVFMNSKKNRLVIN
jgi:hypothetical protein